MYLKAQLMSWRYINDMTTNQVYIQLYLETEDTNKILYVELDLISPEHKAFRRELVKDYGLAKIGSLCTVDISDTLKPTLISFDDET